MSGHINNNQQLLICSLKSGDRKAFAQIYQENSKRIFVKLCQLVKSDKIAEELMQTLFVKLWIKRESIDIQSNLSAYLNRMAANVAYDYFRKVAREEKARIAFLEHIESSYEPHPIISEETTLIQELELLIEKLPPQRKKVLQLCKIQGKSYQEAGRLLGISASTVNDHIVKATRLLRTQLMERKSLNAIILLLLYCF